MNSINRLFSVEEQLRFLVKKRNYDGIDLKYKQYVDVLTKHANYPNIRNKNQFRLIIDTYMIHGDMDYIVRLILLIQYTLKRKNSKQIMDFLISTRGDDIVFYNGIRNFMNKTKYQNIYKKQSQPEFIHYRIVVSVMKHSDFTINKLMDLGCGNGSKASALGKLFNLKKDQVICADIDKWFDYNDIQRKKREITTLAIAEKGPINYQSKSVNIITMIHTLHHWCYDTPDEYITRMRSLHDILDDNGIIVILEHDTFTDIDSCILDIEHGLWECVIKNNTNRFYKDFTSKYLNFIELEIIMQRSGFKMIYYKYYDAGVINKITIPDKSYLGIYKKN